MQGTTKYLFSDIATNKLEFKKSRDAKRRIEDLAEEVPGVKDVTNQLKADTSSVYDTSNILDSEQHNGRKKSSWVS